MGTHTGAAVDGRREAMVIHFGYTVKNYTVQKHNWTHQRTRLQNKSKPGSHHVSFISGTEIKIGGIPAEWVAQEEGPGPAKKA
jgi:hypothetical protein